MLQGVPSIMSARGSSMVIVASYSETNVDADTIIGDTNELTGTAQSFTTIAGTIDHIQFYLKKIGSPTGSLAAGLTSITGTLGVDAVPNATLATADAVSLTALSTSYALITFQFTGVNRYLMSSGNYCVTIIYSGGDASNNVAVGTDGSSPSHAGNSANATSPGPVWTATGSDLAFYVYAVV